MLSDEFWLDESERLFELVFPVAKAAVETATEQAIKTLEVDFGIVFSTEAVNEAAVKLAEQLALDLVVGITSTSKKLFQQYAADWIASGEPLDMLIEQLAPVFGTVRAEAISVTEITRIFAQANTEAWKASGFVHKEKWMTAEDDLVCPICSPLDGKEATLEGMFEGGYDMPPAHPRCRCWLVPVIKL